MTSDDGTGHPSAGQPTEQIRAEAPAGDVRRFRLEVMSGPRAAMTFESTTDRCSIGSHPSNDLVIDDPTVSRFHCEIVASARGVRVRDLGSVNGTVLDGVTVTDAWLRAGSVLRLGRRVVHAQLGAEHNAVAVSTLDHFGSLVGSSLAMRATYALLERVADADATVLLEGETGTGKEAAAESIHHASARRDRPLVVVDCAAVPSQLLESQLFGHERGAFTGAASRRVGAFEEASGGSVFLDEIGELPLELQPKLLRVLERRVVQRIGRNDQLRVDVRVIAATNRDLRAEVNSGRFRADLYYRLAVVKVPLPPLRQRPEDIPRLADHLLAGLGADDSARAELCTPELLASLSRAAWPGNVRELRNYLERCLVLRQNLPLTEAPAATDGWPALDGVPYDEARSRVLAEFERRYVTGLLAAHDGNVRAAARTAGIGRVYLYRLLKKHGG